MGRCTFVIVAGALIVSACVSEHKLSVTQQIVAPPPAIQHPPSAPAAPQRNGITSVSKVVAAGVTTNIDFGFSINPDCSFRAFHTVRVITQPSHGALSVAQREDYPRFLPSNVTFFPCNKVKVPGKAIDYSPSPGYVGSDYFVFQVIRDDGSDQTYQLSIQVK